MDKEINLSRISHLLDLAENNLLEARKLLFEVNQKEVVTNLKCEDRIIEGIFNGEEMITVAGKRYPVPVNYASKSKLVAGDLLKLTIKEDGSFLYKQIKPTSRKKIIGTLSRAGSKYLVRADGKNYHILVAAVTYHQAKAGDKVAILVPVGGENNWAALENIVEQKEVKG